MSSPGRLPTLAGLLFLAGAVVVALLPDAVGGVAAAVRSVPDGAVVGLLAAAVALLALALARGTSEDQSTDALREETEETDRAPTPGADVEHALDVATDPDAPRRDRTAAREVIRDRLRATTIDVLVLEHDRETAEALIADGEWTDDPRAAATISDDVPRPPLTLWLWDLLAREDAFRRRVRHAVAAIEEVER